MGSVPMVTAASTDAEICFLADALASCIDVEGDAATDALALIGCGLRALLQGGQSPAQAVKTVGAMVLAMTGVDFDLIDGPRAMPKRD